MEDGHGQVLNPCHRLESVPYSKFRPPRGGKERVGVIDSRLRLVFPAKESLRSIRPLLRRGKERSQFG